MSTKRSPAYLGQNVLVVVDPVNGFLDAFRSTVTSLSATTHKSFTLLCCCPTHYWEHSGAHRTEVQQQIETITNKMDDKSDYAKTCLNQAQAILQEAGVSDSHIHVKSLTGDSLVAVVMNELKLRRYTGIIVSKYHQDIVSRLQRKGITDIFRKIPQVQVHEMDLTAETAVPDM